MTTSATDASATSVMSRLSPTMISSMSLGSLTVASLEISGGLTRAVDRLEAAGLVERQACPEDRRSTYAVLTDAGEDRIRSAVPVHVEEVVRVLYQTFTPEELVTVTDLTRRLRDSANPCAAEASKPDGLGDLG